MKSHRKELFITIFELEVRFKHDAIKCVSSEPHEIEIPLDL